VSDSEAARRRDAMHTRLVEDSRDCIKMLDLDGRLLSMNAGGMQALEICDLGPFLGTSWIEFWQGQDREAARAAVEIAAKGGAGRFVGYFETVESHSPRWFDVVLSPILGPDGRPERLIATSRDVTDLHRTQEQLEQRVHERTESLERASGALRSIVEGVEAETGDRFVSLLVEHLAAALGVEYAFVSQLSDDGSEFTTLAVWGPDGPLANFTVPVVGTPCEAVLSGEICHHASRLQEVFPRDTGLAGWDADSYVGVPLVEESGRIVGHFAIFDSKPMPEAANAISIMRIFAMRARAELERLRAETALRDSEMRLSRVLESAMDAIVTIDTERQVVLWNGAAEKVFRCPASEALGRSFDRFVTPALAQSLASSARALLRGEQAAPYIWAPEGLRARRGDGEEFPVEATLSHVEVGGRGLFTLIVRDVDERNRAQETLRQLALQNQYLQEEIRAEHNADEIVGESRALSGALAQVRLVAGTDSTVLILGETGSGKEVIARAVHAASKRAERPLIKVNCAALPTGLIESELFGHEKGAFTGATERRVGRFELADGGTLFLDEIGEIPPEMQVKLLRVLQEREFERVGGTQTRKVDVRVIAATNRDLAHAVEEGRFRRDLFYRLNVFPIALPPLRERSEDIPLLVHYFVSRFAAKLGRKLTRVPAQTMLRLVAYPWPGNVRELENVIERAVILSPGPELEVGPEIPALGSTAPARVTAAPALASAPAARHDSSSLEDVERAHIQGVLREAQGRIEGPTGAAAKLGLAPSTLRSRMKKLGIGR
jgi:PAS domain S-box-containing protein